MSPVFEKPAGTKTGDMYASGAPARPAPAPF